MRFVGDGSWGVKQEVCPDSKALLHPELFLDYANDKPNHVWLVTLTRTPVGHTINYTSVDLEGIARTTIDLLPFQFNTVTP